MPLTTATPQQVRMFGRPELEAIAERYPQELVNPDGILDVFDAFEPVMGIETRDVRIKPGESFEDFEARCLYLGNGVGMEFTGRRIVVADSCVLEGIKQTICTNVSMGRPVGPHFNFDDPVNRADANERARLVEYGFLRRNVAYLRHKVSVLEQAEKLEAGQHFFVFGVRLGVKIRHEQRKLQAEANSVKPEPTQEEVAATIEADYRWLPQ